MAQLSKSPRSLGRAADVDDPDDTPAKPGHQVRAWPSPEQPAPGADSPGERLLEDAHDVGWNVPGQQSGVSSASSRCESRRSGQTDGDGVRSESERAASRTTTATRLSGKPQEQGQSLSKDDEIRLAVVDKRALTIRKRFTLTRRMVQERNLLWFAPPLVDLQGLSLGMFHEWHPMRQASSDLLRSPLLQAFCMGITIASCALLAVRPPFEAVSFGYDVYGDVVALPFHDWKNVYFVGEIVALAALAAEVAMAVVARGLVQGHYAFVKDPFNVLDAFVLVTSVVEMVAFALFGWTVILRGLRILRLLKPVLLLTQCAGARAAVAALRRASGELLMLAAILLVFIATFAGGLVTPFGGALVQRCVVRGTDTEFMIEAFNETSRVRLAVPERFCQVRCRVVLPPTRVTCTNRTCPCLSPAILGGQMACDRALSQ